MSTTHTSFDTSPDFGALALRAKRIRIHSLSMIHHAGASHIGSCLSSADLLAYLYGHLLQVDPARPDWADRDRFLLSKGHAAAALYATLADRGFFPESHLKTYCVNGSDLLGHVSHHVPGIEISTGSLGHALPIAAGMALAAQRLRSPWKTYTILSDGELDEGSNWEAALFAGHHHLSNLTAIVDYNKIQSYGKVKDILDLEPLVDKWKSFRWRVTEIDGHELVQIDAALRQPDFMDDPRPHVVIAHTIKGKGVSIMEHKLAWHYSTPNAQQLAQAIEEITAAPIPGGSGAHP